MSTMDLFYRTKVSFLPTGATASCGFDEPVTAATVGAGGRIAFSPDWYLDIAAPGSSAWTSPNGVGQSWTARSRP